MQRRCNAAVVYCAHHAGSERRGPAERGLSTARAALQVAWLLAARPAGHPRRRGRRGARQERLDRLQPARQPVRRGRGRAPLRRPVPALARVPRDGRERRRDAGRRAARPLGRRRRAARAHAQARLPRRRCAPASCTSCVERGARGCRKLPGLERRHRATTPTRSRSARSCSRCAPPEAVERYLQPGLRRFTPHTITDPDVLRDELREVRRRGFAVDREEFDEDFCCIAAPVLDRARAVRSRRSGSR